jgi:hypothetical protein
MALDVQRNRRGRRTSVCRPSSRARIAFAEAAALDPVVSMAVDADQCVVLRTADGAIYHLPTAESLDRAGEEILRKLEGRDE